MTQTQNKTEVTTHCAYDEIVETDTLIENPKNPNQHPKEQIKLLAKIISHQGWRAPITVSKRSGFITKGHARLLAAKLNGYKFVPVDKQNYPNEAMEWADMIADNKIAELANVNEDLLGEITVNMPPDFDLELFGIPDFSFNPAEVEGLTDPDEIPEEAPEICKPGELWELGEHRLLCGDATNEKDVGRLLAGQKLDLIFTDPPYGIEYLPENKELAKKGKLAGDTKEFKEFGKLVLKTIDAIEKNLREGGCYYIFMGFEQMENILRGIREKGNMKPYALLVWDRRTPTLRSFPQDYIPVCEFFVYGWKRGLGRKRPGGGEHQTQIWSLTTEKVSEMIHPTQKIVALPANALLNSSEPEDLIGDFFGGSGSTLIACEKLNRKCFMIEIEPKYCDVIISRWENFSGQKAKKANA